MRGNAWLDKELICFSRRILLPGVSLLVGWLDSHLFSQSIS